MKKTTKKYAELAKQRVQLVKGLVKFKPVYFFPAGYPTIGYGHVVKDNEDFSAGIDETQAEELLRQDAQPAKLAVLRLINVPLIDGSSMRRFLSPATLVVGSFNWDASTGALQRSTLRRKITREEHAEVPEQFMRWVWAGSRKLKELIRRRSVEACLYKIIT